MNVQIVATLETNDHDGYCSGSKCEYKVRDKKFIFKVDGSMKDIIEDLENEYWISLLPKRKVRSGSGYCSSSVKAILAELDPHDYRYTIKSIDIIN